MHIATGGAGEEKRTFDESSDDSLHMKMKILAAFCPRAPPRFPRWPFSALRQHNAGGILLSYLSFRSIFRDSSLVFSTTYVLWLSNLSIFECFISFS